MISARGTRATSPCASPDGTAYHVLAWRRSAVPPTGMAIDHVGGGGGSEAHSSSVRWVRRGGGGGGGGRGGRGWRRRGGRDRERGGGGEPGQGAQRLGQQCTRLQRPGRH